MHQTEEESERFFKWILGVASKVIRADLVDYFQLMATAHSTHDKASLDAYARKNILNPQRRVEIVKAAESLKKDSRGLEDGEN